ncbi:MAG: prolyl oligopeptidase family serine peptidase [Bacteroidota bacterium]
MGKIVIDNNRDRIAYVCVPEKAELKKETLQICSIFSGKAKFEYQDDLKVNDSLQIMNIDKFSNDGVHLFLRVQPLTEVKNGKDRHIEIWSYQDRLLKSQQNKFKGTPDYMASLNLKSKEIYRIQQKYETAEILASNDNFIKITYRESDWTEVEWNKKSAEISYLLNLTTNNRTLIPSIPISLSPDNNFLICNDSQIKNLTIYEISTGETIELTKPINNSYDLAESIAIEDVDRYTFAGWYGNSILFYDKYDIWQYDLGNKVILRNLTKGYGRKNKMTFRFANEGKNSIYSFNDLQLLNAFNNKNKQNGFYKLNLQNSKAPEVLVMKDQYFESANNKDTKGFPPLKAINAKVWLVKSERSDYSPNYFVTKDFKRFDQLSKVHPEKQFNWMSSELVNFQTKDGKMNQGIMYKPENFDSSKRYPVILSYYEKFSDLLNHYTMPDVSGSSININWFVNKGYIVCTPDIIYTQGDMANNCVNTMEGIASALSKLPYVDSTHIGLHGHSFGGYETNLIITHSNRFSAAVSASGYSDLISDVLTVKLASGTNFSGYRAEIGQGRIGFNLWQKPDIYVKNSPVFFADKVATPLLMMNNELDGVVNFSQGLEFFIALRRLNKRVWMLNYQRGMHTLFERQDAIDYTKRMEQFFGHYLKGEPMPEWMKNHN